MCGVVVVCVVVLVSFVMGFDVVEYGSDVIGFYVFFGIGGEIDGLVWNF